MKALIIVDLQNDFLPGGSLEVPRGDEVIAVINGLVGRYDLVVATQDWHPNDHKSFASQHSGYRAYQQVELNGLPQVLWPDHCIQGTVGAEISKDLDHYTIEAIFRKGTDRYIDSYSGFFDNGRLKNTGMNGYLRDRGIEEVHICGLAADFCVYFTAMDALELGYRTVILSKATKAIDKDSYISKKEQFMQKGGLFL